MTDSPSPVPGFQMVKGGRRKKAMVESLLSISPDMEADKVRALVEGKSPAVIPPPGVPAATAPKGKTYVWQASKEGRRTIRLPEFNPATDALVVECGRHFLSFRVEGRNLALLLSNGDQLIFTDTAPLTPEAIFPCLRWAGGLLPIPFAEEEAAATATTLPVISLDSFLQDDFNPSSILREIDGGTPRRV